MPHSREADVSPGLKHPLFHYGKRTIRQQKGEQAVNLRQLECFTLNAPRRNDAGAKLA